MENNKQIVIENIKIKLIYYLLVTLLFKIKYSGSLYIILVFIFAAFTLFYSMTFYNYKIYPTRILGKVFYWLSALIKLLFYFFIMNHGEKNTDYTYIYLAFLLMIVDGLISLIYYIKPSKLFYPYRQEDIDSYYLKKTNEIMVGGFKIDLKYKILFILTLVGFNIYQYINNRDIVYLLASMLINLLIAYFVVLRKRNKNR